MNIIKTKFRTLCKTLCITTLMTISFSSLAASKTYAANWPSGPNVSSGSAILMDASSGTVLYGYNEYEKKYPASITKIMTTLIALENSSPNDKITLSSDAVNTLESGSANIGRKPGETFLMKDALYAVMLASANEVSNGVAETISGSVAEFANKMNSKAKELGCKNTHFINPHGLSDPNHYTTAYDMALISKAALKLDSFRKITGTTSYTFPKTNMQDPYTFANHQKMLTGAVSSLKYDGCIGGKTGYTSASGNTLVTFAKRDNLTLISVVMNTNYNNQYTDSKALLDYGFNNFKSYSIMDTEKSALKNDLNKSKDIFTIDDDYSAMIYFDKDNSVLLPNDAKYKDVKKDVSYNKDITLSEGENIIGTITYTYGDKQVGKHDIIMNYYQPSSVPDISLPDDLSVVVNGSSINNAPPFESSTTNNALSKIATDIALIGLCSLVIISIYIFFRQNFMFKRRRRAYNSRRRHSRPFWDDFTI